VFREDFHDIDAVVGNGGVVAGTPTISNGMTITQANAQGIIYERTRTLLNGATKAVFKLKWHQVLAADGNNLLTRYASTVSEFRIYSTGGNLVIMWGAGVANAAFALADNADYDLRIVYDGTLAAANRIRVWNMVTGVPVSVALTITGTIPTSISSGPDRLMIGGMDGGAPSYASTVGTIFRHVSIIQGLAWTTTEMQDDRDGVVYSKLDPVRAAVSLPMRSAFYADTLPVPTTELLTDGDMEAAGTVAYSAVQAVLSKEGNPHSGTRCLRVSYDGSHAIGAARQVSLFTAGQVIRVLGWARGDGTSAPQVVSNGVAVWVGTSSTSWQYVDATFVAVGTNIDLYSLSLAAGHYVEFDDFIVQQTTNRLSDPAAEAAGITAWTAIRSAVITKQAGSRTGGSGSQIIRVGYGGVGSPTARQSVLVIGRTYAVSGWLRGDGVNAASMDDGSTTFISVASNTWTYLPPTQFVAATTAFNLTLNAAAGYAEFDDVVLMERTMQTSNLGQAGNVVLGDGVTTTTFPAMLQPRGISCDTGDYVTVPAARVPAPTGAFTAYIALKTTSTTNNPGYFGRVTSAPLGWLMGGVISGGSIVPRCFLDASAYTGAKPINDGRMHVLVITHDGVNTLTMYTDDVVDGGGSHALPTVVSTDLVLNNGVYLNRVAASYYAAGVIDGLCATPTQVRALGAMIRRAARI
jgi:hypothetical protein